MTVLAAVQDLITVVGMVVVMFIVGGLQVLAKLKQDQQKREQQRQRELSPQPPASRQQPQSAPRGQSPMTPTEKMQAYRRQAAQPARPAAPPPADPSRRLVRRAPYRQGPPSTAPITLQPWPHDEDETVRVDAELRAEQRRLAQEELERQRRLANLQSQVATRHVRTARPAVSAESFIQIEETVERGIEVDLHDPEQARRAIIFQEILAPPVALRNGPSSWGL